MGTTGLILLLPDSNGGLACIMQQDNGFTKRDIRMWQPLPNGRSGCHLSIHNRSPPSKIATPIDPAPAALRLHSPCYLQQLRLRVSTPLFLSRSIPSIQILRSALPNASPCPDHLQQTLTDPYLVWVKARRLSVLIQQGFVLRALPSHVIEIMTE